MNKEQLKAIEEAAKLMNEKEMPTKGRIVLDIEGVYHIGEPPENPFIPALNKTP